ncbi:efflux transporter outer membrane subunit [Ramlibacter sp.]|uniref:efflux transporter outer membrane subunit n=1 Tax=Ramlibacter sp. TaxID=1917967 RepID=UPI002B539A82|nr:efflux transporter outer membrane subunit [Ramlibacter sp.]HWI81036.1 efflux transporter outer membrane subunit [Ramlibacter sp.]
MKTTSTFPRLAALAAALALAGCANMGGIAPQSALRSAESVGLGAAPAGSAFRVGDAWWREFGDQQLDALIAQALAGHPSLQLAQARLARAQAAAEGARANGEPQVNGNASATRQHFTENGLYPPPIAGSNRTTADLGVSGSWELDFFGRHQAALAAALGASRAAEADTQAARVLLASNVARAYLQLARANDQLAVAQRTLAQREESLRLVGDRVRAGLDTNLELRQSEGALPETRQQIEALREQAALAQHALAALTGQGNREVVTTQPSLARLKALPLPAQLPSDLLGQRADVVAARWRVEAAGQDVRGAKAQFYPSVNIVGLVGLSSFGLNKLLDLGSTQWSLGPAVHLPIFDAGRLRANLRGKTADLDAAIESYNAAVLDAIRDTADQVASAQSIARQQAQQRDAQASAEAAYELARQRYRAGLGTYLHVLTAETAVLNQRRLAVDLAARAADTQVGLARALGGGARPDPAPAAAVAASTSK